MVCVFFGVVASRGIGSIEPGSRPADEEPVCVLLVSAEGFENRPSKVVLGG